jgi:1-deoxy-D-xylulose-5-phosphate reductoisomerase
MNKGFEVIESKWLFGLDLDQIHVVVHPQSIVHSYVEFIDGSVLAQLGVPDMRLPIQYALMYPDRQETPTEPLNLIETGTLTFEEPDVDRFPCLSHAYDAAETGGTMPAVLSGADELAVEAFLDGELQFHRIPAVVRSAMDQHDVVRGPELQDVLDAERWAREAVRREIHTTRMPVTPDSPSKPVSTTAG